MSKPVFYFPFFISLISLVFVQCSSKTIPRRNVTHTQNYSDSGWPQYIDLNIGETESFSWKINNSERSYKITLINIEYIWETNLWVPERFANKSLKEAKVTLKVNGKRVVIPQRAYQMPIGFNGLRIYIENTRVWAKKADFAAIENFTKDVRIAVCNQDESWGSKDMRFPIAEYRWRSSPYNNSWSSLVPYNKLYYHRGEDYGVIPDKLDIRAPLKGKVIATPLPNGDRQSNAVIVKSSEDFSYRISHLNIEFVKPEVVLGAGINRAQILGKTGSTYNGARNQIYDPHMHINFMYKGQAVSPFPYMIEAYLRDYPDTVLAIAGGYANTLPKQEVTLDATRSIVRKGYTISSFTWILHDGRIINKPKIRTQYTKPGLYTEELIVKTKDGAEDRDYVQVRVYDKKNPMKITYGWAYHFPVRDIKAGTKVLIFNKLYNTKGPVTIDFGDRSGVEKIEEQIDHIYKYPGIYTVTLTTLGLQNDQVTIKMKVVVEGA
ncbi:PKD domain-containing protein [Paradesertivirga mongoliensis]|uniref:PKD domain-containing protein n=1 Tax=Paradesertivirga mongoliensis TaxID=2100740 RepID=A0ABW4ZK32_9SPHI|nr:PKD domain-containing protein [Pedobacter mongoliensis]